MNPPLDRRQLLLAGTLAATVARNQAAPLTESDGRIVELWPEGVPGAKQVTITETVEEATPGTLPRDRSVWKVTRPTITVFEPRSAPNGITWLVIAGGGYRRVVIDREGFDTAAWLTERGFGAAVLRYRLPGDGWPSGPDAPVNDGDRALRWLRTNGGANARRLGVIGFSAGGHLAARLITEPDLALQPDFAVLMYPVIFTTGAAAHPGSTQRLIMAGVAPRIWRSRGIRRCRASMRRRLPPCWCTPPTTKLCRSRIHCACTTRCARPGCAASCTYSTPAAMASACAVSPARASLRGRRSRRTGRCRRDPSYFFSIVSRFHCAGSNGAVVCRSLG